MDFFTLSNAKRKETSKILCRIVIPQVLDENRLLFFNLSQHGLQIACDI